MLHRRMSLAVVATRASAKHWMKLEPLHCKQLCLPLLVEVEMFKPKCHMKRRDWVNSHLAHTLCGESSVLLRSCWRAASTTEHSGCACNRPSGNHNPHVLQKSSWRALKCQNTTVSRFLFLRHRLHTFRLSL